MSSGERWHDFLRKPSQLPFSAKQRQQDILCASRRLSASSSKSTVLSEAPRRDLVSFEPMGIVDY
jgi:hypothetical protein